MVDTTTQTEDTTTQTEVVSYEVADGIATLTLNRPDRLNAWTPRMATRYFDLLEEAGRDPDVRVIIVTGAGRGFCAGADFEVLQGRDESAADLDPRPQTHPLGIPKPIIAAINGPCAGIGFCLALACDIRFAAAGAKFTTAFSHRGLIAEHGSSWILPRLVGPAVALDLLFSGRVFLAEEAAELGVVNRVCDPEALLDEARSYAKELVAKCSPTSMAVMKRQVWMDLERDLAPSVKDATRLMEESFTRPDFPEGVQSYIEKREPEFPPVDHDALP